MEELDIKEILYEVWRNKSLIAIFLIIGIVVGVIYSAFFVTPMYKSSTTILLSKATTSNTTNNTITSSDITMNQKLVSTYSEIIKSKSVINQVKENLSVDISGSNISVQSKKDTELLEITVRYIEPVMAANIANNIVEVFTSKVKEVYNIENVSVIDVAEITNEPDNINMVKNVGMFAIGSLVIAALIIFVKMYFSNTIKSQEDAERLLGLPVLAVIPEIKE